MEVPELVSDTSSVYQSSPEIQPFDKSHDMGTLANDMLELDYLLISACISCNPNNTTGFVCPTPFSIITKKTKKNVENWHTNLIRGDKFREIGIRNHEECTGCHRFIPSKIPNLNNCSCCGSHSCDSINPNGCSRNFKITPLECKKPPKLPPNSLNWILSNHNAATLLKKYETVDNLLGAVVQVLPKSGENARILSNGMVKKLDDNICSNCVWKDVVVDGLHLLWKHTNSSK
ncbi:hypothetical protein E3Q06_00389 [Wallemia mellicola]|uniref:E3 ubiquitin-protein ligase CHFR cysteine rich domain-containing protein n=1 Tax=Wallemia mellicola TaxID=1708541 RepID=A0AB74KGR1_9BASI|nr:hypothetical protein E3Q21_00212 [Wallemia mellicola]TIB92203.1 hypothetical protein E3Q20_00467 [Wallemia mellicola]TIC25722.1 hypothetical protein E3Q12_00828 [Wallemia mellicola]TIC43786.1 hypothetical protein E3Q07_00389 [Wallemia mellicola]TIC52793.1 hypothetical protein E3Q06_00389 [Wallemia mellicola]